MTQEEKESLQLIAYRLTQMESSMTAVKQDCAQIGQILSKLRLDEQVLAEQKIKIKEIEHRQCVTDKKQDKRLDALEEIVLPSHLSWTETADNQKKLVMKAAVTFIGAFGSLGGVLAYFK